METKNESKGNITAKPDRNEVEGADTGCYRHVNQLGITPAKWGVKKTDIEEDRNQQIVSLNIDDGHQVVCEINGAWVHQERIQANANLIKSAPDLYDALKEIYLKHKDIFSYDDTLIVEGALKSARGIID